MRRKAFSTVSSGTETGSWIKISVKTSPEASDAISNLLFELGAGGVEVKEVSSSSTLIAFYPPDDLVGERLLKIRAFFKKLRECGLDPSPAKIEFDEIEDENWIENWKSVFNPIRVGRHIVVSPTWCQPELERDDIVIWLDPGMAFGTGQHPTTRLTLTLMEESIFEGAEVLDVGTGSGILSIAAVKLGAERVTAIDIEPGVIPVARKNASLNDVEERVTFIAGDISEVPPEPKYDLVACNILTRVNVLLLPDLRERLKPGGIALFSGVLIGEDDRMKDACRREGYEVLETIEEEMWLALRCRLKST